MTSTLAPAAIQLLSQRPGALHLPAARIEEGDVVKLPGGKQVDVLDVTAVGDASRRIVVAGADTLTVPGDLTFEVLSAVRGFEIPCRLCGCPTLAVIELADTLPDGTTVCKGCDDATTAEARAEFEGRPSTTPATPGSPASGQPRTLYATRENPA